MPYADTLHYAMIFAITTLRHAFDALICFRGYMPALSPDTCCCQRREDGC